MKNLVIEDWFDAQSQAKKQKMFMHDRFHFINNDLTLLVIRVVDGEALGKDLFQFFVRSLQYFFGIDNVYRMDDDIFVVIARITSENIYQSNMQTYETWYKSVRDWETETHHTSMSFQCGYCFGKAVNENEVQAMYEYALKAASQATDNQPVGVNYIKTIPIDASHVERFYQDEKDEITGLLNKKRFCELASRIIWENKISGVVIYCNIVNFKIYNDTYSYSQGNAFLSMFAKKLREVFPGRFISRFGSDQFYMICCEDEVGKIDLIRSYILENRQKVDLDLRAGVYPFTENTKDNILLICDKARSVGKSLRNTTRVYRYYDSNFAGVLEHTRYVVENIDHAINNGYIKVYTQPVIRALTGEVCGMEALARWDDPQYGLLSPAVFVDALEEYRQIHKLDLYILKVICANYRNRVSHFEDVVPISVNLSRLDFELTDCFQTVEEIMQYYEVPRDMINFEITETAISSNVVNMHEELQKFKNAGYQIWLDDFGSGYSSLNVLKDFAFDELKIDMKFLSTMTPQSRTIIRSVVNMAKELGMQTLAEGVETKEQLDFLTAIGCEKIQGYYYSKPIEASICDQVMKEKGLKFESWRKRYYLDQIGHVNILSANPFDFSHEKENDETLALALIEVKDRQFKAIRQSEKFVEVIQSLGMTNFHTFEERMNDYTNRNYEQFYAIADKARISHKVETLDFMENDKLVRLFVRFISQEGLTSAFLVRLENVSDSNIYQQAKLRINNLQSVYALYEHVYLVDLNKDLVKTLYANSHFEKLEQSTTISAVLDQFIEQEVYPDDIEIYRNFFDMQTISRRLEEAPHHQIGAMVRLHKNASEYHWVYFRVKPIDGSQYRRFIVTLANTTTVDTDRFIRIIYPSLTQQEAISSYSLFDAVYHSHFGIFWKDKKRRFVGVNDVFKKYYQIQSDDQILGKTDEDMGWHINPDPFKEDEERVIQKGEVIRNIPGKCLCDGEIKDIVASKAPLYNEQGEIVGLLGYFVDAGEESEMRSNLKRLSLQDGVTEVLNEVGLQSCLVDYQDSYNYRHLDFGMILISLHNFTHISHYFGDKFENALLRKITQIIKSVVRYRGMIAHSKEDTFVIVMHATEMDTLKELGHQICTKLNDVKICQGIPITIYTSHAEAMYSETNDILLLKSLIASRLRP